MSSNNNSPTPEERLNAIILRTNRSLFFIEKYRKIRDMVVFPPFTLSLKIYSFLHFLLPVSVLPVIFTLTFEPQSRANLPEIVISYAVLFSLLLIFNFFQKKSVLKTLQNFSLEEVIDFDQLPFPYNKEHLSLDDINALIADGKTSQEAKEFAQTLSAYITKQSLFYFGSINFRMALADRSQVLFSKMTDHLRNT